MALFKVSIKQSGQYNGCKVEKGMEVDARTRSYCYSFSTQVWIEHKTHHGSMEFPS